MDKHGDSYPSPGTILQLLNSLILSNCFSIIYIYEVIHVK